MTKYAILQNPGHNRVYYNLAGKLAVAELKVAVTKINQECSGIEIKDISGIRYIIFETESPLSENDFEIISRLSFVFGLFQIEMINEKPYLLPIEKYSYEYIDNKISSILKYPGKTNELFTKMMVNVALLSSKFSHNQEIRLLDPVSGKGTTLFESIVYGFDSYGVEAESKSIHEANIFFKKYLQEERFKHTIEKRLVYGNSKSDYIHSEEYSFARSKSEFKDKKYHKILSLINGNSQDCDNYFKKNFFNLIVGDLPYGIAHGNNLAGKKAQSLTRSPEELLGTSLEAWHTVMKNGGSVVMAWNSNVISKTKLSTIFEENSFSVLSDPPYDEFEHQVDRAIKRDIIVAQKK
jgi:hypothetical protein